MSSIFTLSKSKPAWLVSGALFIGAVLILASPLPASATFSQSQSTGSPQSPNAGCPPDGQCFADVPPSNPFYAFINSIYQQDLVSGYACGATGEPCDPY